MTKKICTVCDKEYLIRDDCATESKYCSRNCRKNKGNVHLVCDVCGKIFVRKQWEITQQLKRVKDPKPYCSKKCYFERSPQQKVQCYGCGNQFMAHQSRIRYYSELYCTKECAVKFGTIGQLTFTPLKKSRYQRFIGSLRHTAEYLKWRKSCLDRDGHKCCRCPREQKITVHHRISMYEFFRRHGFNRRAIEQDKDFFDTRNGETLCRGCHAKEHRNENRRSRRN